MKDYNNELETILDKKLFSEDVKNILLSMFYKIDISYDDYSTVKRNVEDKKDYLESLLKQIEQCEEISLMKPVEDEKKENIYTKFKNDNAKKKIQVYPNEKAMLYALNDLKYTKMHLNENYKLIKNSLPYIINIGREINNTEIIRDFDAWSWNIQIDEITGIEINLIYQNIQILLGYKKLKELLDMKSLKSDLKVLENNLKLLYDEENINSFLFTIYKISIILCIMTNETERKRLFSEKKLIEKEYNKLNNKEELLEDIQKNKKEIREKIKQIDIILNNSSLLFEEYKKRNESLPEHSKIFSLSHFSEILLRERKKEMQKIKDYNKMVDPKNYTKTKLKYEKDINFLSDINFDEKAENSTLNLMIKLQEIFLDCMKMKIEKLENKKDIINFMYILRYYNFIPFNKTQYIYEVKELENKLQELENIIIEKMYDFKIINKSIDFNIIKNIFHTKIISLENIEIELKNDKESLTLILYDEKTIAETIKINKIDTEKVKFNKKLKLFN